MQLLKLIVYAKNMQPSNSVYENVVAKWQRARLLRQSAEVLASPTMILGPLQDHCVIL